MKQARTAGDSDGGCRLSLGLPAVVYECLCSNDKQCFSPTTLWNM